MVRYVLAIMAGRRAQADFLVSRALFEVAMEDLAEAHLALDRQTLRRRWVLDHEGSMRPA